MYCQACGTQAATKHVTFYQNIGALVIRFSRSVDGDLCKACVHKYFWEFTSISLLLGWWGIISFILNPFLILNNVFYYLSCLGMPAPHAPPRGEEPEAFSRPAPRGDAKDEC